KAPSSLRLHPGLLSPWFCHILPSCAALHPFGSTGILLPSGSALALTPSSATPFCQASVFACIRSVFAFILFQFSLLPVGSVKICIAVGITVFPFITWIYYYMNTELRKHWPQHCTTAL
uniref:Transmembrane protein 220 n=1 Tax=Sinocyclocheilus rhinocerous TaxID=307959 RepID=A0A673GMF3_9TELE